jgi:hypothetical protein
MRIRPSFIILTFISLFAIHLLLIPYARCEPPKDKLVLKGLYLGMEITQALATLKQLGKDTKTNYFIIEALYEQVPPIFVLLTYEKLVDYCYTLKDVRISPKNHPTFIQTNRPLSVLVQNCFSGSYEHIRLHTENNIVNSMLFYWRTAFDIEDATFDMFSKSFCDTFSIGPMEPNLSPSGSFYHTFRSERYNCKIKLTDKFLYIENIGNIKPKF